MEGHKAAGGQCLDRDTREQFRFREEKEQRSNLERQMRSFSPEEEYSARGVLALGSRPQNYSSGSFRSKFSPKIMTKATEET